MGVRPAWPGCTVGPGCDFPDLQTALSKHFAIAPFNGLPLVYQIADGTYPQPCPALFEMWAAAKNVTLRGANGYAVSLTALAGNVLTVSDATNIAVGNYILSGGPVAKQLDVNGAWTGAWIGCPGALKVQAVSGNQVTVSGIPANCTIVDPVPARVIKTVLQFPGFSGIRIWNGGGAKLNIVDLVCEGTGSGFGIDLQDGGDRAWIGPGAVGLVGFQDNVIGYYNAQINGDGMLVTQAAARDNIVFSGNSTLSDLQMVSVNAGRNGISARRGMIEATSAPAVSVGSANKDYYCYTGGALVAPGAVGSTFFAEPGGDLIH